ncbi:MAG TPA: DUF6585 family protein [Fimbriiglobus sp.]|jgi:hypothetical protein
MELDDPDPIDAPADDGVALARDRLGEPAASYGVSPVLFWGKLALGLALILGGLTGTILWFTLGPGTVGHWEFHLMFWPPFLGVMLLVHLIRHRGVKVLLFPTGVLHLRPGHVDSFPWEEITRVTIRAGAGTAVVDKDANGTIRSAWITVPTTVVQVWNSWTQLTRADNVQAKLTTVLAGYPDLAKEIQRETFAHLWPPVRDAFAAGESVPFGPFSLSAEGLASTVGKKKLAWQDVKKITPSQKMLSIEKKGKWIPWMAVTLEQIPNPHLFFALTNLATGGKLEGKK